MRLFLYTLLLVAPLHAEVIRQNGLNQSNASVTVSSLTISNMTQGSVIFSGASGQLAQDNASLFFDNANNRLGIGTASPARVLHVVGSPEIQTTDSIYFSSGTAASQTIGRISYGVGAADAFSLFGVANHSLSLGAEGAAYLFINTAGNVGVQTSAPCSTCTLHVIGSVVANGTLTQSVVSCATGIQTDATGKLSACVASDRGLKTSVTPLEYNPTAVDALKPVSYRWKDAKARDSKAHYGFIAQDVEAVAAQAVVPAGKGLKGLDQAALTALLVMEIKELRKRVLVLESK